MGIWLRDLIVALGIAFGLVQAPTDPVLICRITRSHDAVCAAATIENGMNEDISSLIHAGNPVTIRLSSWIRNAGTEKSGEFIHTIRYSPQKKEYTIFYSETGKNHRTYNGEAAISIFLSYYSLVLCGSEDLSRTSNSKIRIQCKIEMPEEDFFDAGVLWNYQSPEWQIEYSRLSEIPF